MIKTWQERCEEHPDHEGIVTEQMIRERMQEEIDELRQALNVDAVNISQERVDETDKFNHITVVCHKDHDRGYEDFQGKCLLCVVDELMLEMGNLMIQKQRAEKREWVGLSDEEIYAPWPLATRIEFARWVEAKLKEKNCG